MNLRKIHRQLGIKYWLFDLDDSLIDTNPIFVRQMQLFAQAAAKTLAEDETRVHQSLKAINDSAFKDVSVNPARWDVVAKRLAQEFEAEANALIPHLPILGQIYETPIPFKEGAQDLLDMFKRDRIPMGIVTHANEEWTRRKVSWLGLDRFIDSKHIHIVHEDSHKGPDDWLKAIFKRRFKISSLAILGDSLRGDIVPCHQIGVAHIFCVPSPWVVYSQGAVPEGTHVLKATSDLIPTLERLASG